MQRIHTHEGDMDRCSCGMVIAGPREYHPHAACLIFKAAGNGDEVFDNLSSVVDYGMRAQKAGLTLAQAMHDLTLVYKSTP